jgi:hypothetical protein
MSEAAVESLNGSSLARKRPLEEEEEMEEEGEKKVEEEKQQGQTPPGPGIGNQVTQTGLMISLPGDGWWNDIQVGYRYHVHILDMIMIKKRVKVKAYQK